MFDLETRVNFIKEATGNTRVIVKPFNSLLIEFAKNEDVSTIIRGLRNSNDFEYELQMGYANNSLDNKLETIYFMPKLNNAFISSSIVRELINFNGNISHLIPKVINKYIRG